MSDAKNSATKEVEATTNNVDMGFKKKLIPVFFGIGVFLFDQITKWLVIKYIPLYTIKMQLFGDFFQLVHVRNLGAAFSVGGNLPQGLRSVLLAAVPLVILVIAMVVYFRNNTFTWLQRWFICGIVGGGFGNLFDRIFRKEGVVDFIDIKFYGLFGFERFPTFNMADSFIMVCGILLMISFFVQVRNERKASKNANDKNTDGKKDVDVPNQPDDIIG